MVTAMRFVPGRWRHLKKLLHRRGATREDAEDLVQEAVLRLHVYTRAGRLVRDPEAFVTRTAFNLVVDGHRHARRDLYESEPVEELNLTDIGPMPDEVLAAEELSS
jgi:DNA-directed RNA polymerase specialized sigma24 family protein